VVCGRWLVVGKNMRTIIAILVLLSALSAQTVIQTWEMPCNEEVVEPNFETKIRQHTFGRLIDPVGAPLQESKVVLRKKTEKGKFVDYRNVLTDKDGHFDLSVVEPGEYRFLPAPNRGWKQPKSVSCRGESECKVNLVVELNPTDQPYAGCPIQYEAE
jgi:hypothetical protein